MKSPCRCQTKKQTTPFSHWWGDGRSSVSRKLGKILLPKLKSPAIDEKIQLRGLSPQKKFHQEIAPQIKETGKKLKSLTFFICDKL